MIRYTKRVYSPQIFMPDTNYLVKRNGFWTYRRRVPARFSELDPRETVKQSTKISVISDPNKIRANIVADGINREVEAYWKGLAEGRGR